MKTHSKISLFLFIICAFGADEDGVKRVSEMEGNSVTLKPGLREPFNLIQWRFEDSGSVIFDIKLYKTGMPRLYLSDERFRDRLQVNNQTGSLTISNMRITDSGLYELWIEHSTGITYESFNVTVYVPGLSPGAVAGIVVAVVSMLAAAATAAAGLYYKCSLDKKRTESAKKKDQTLQIKPCSTGSDTMTGIVPKSKAKGIDICGQGKNIYIIRSDLGCYMKTSDLNSGSDISIFSLHPSCKDGDHYLGDSDGYFYIIKGKKYRRVKNLTTDSEAELYTLHPHFQGGDHYLTKFGYFYVIFQGQGTFRRTSSLKEGSYAVNNLHPNLRNGLYYWGMPNHCYFLKPASEWGVQFCCSSSLSNNDNPGVYSVHPDVLNFLPGGLSVTKGPSFGIWENIKTISNDSNTTVTWKKKINKKVGWNKEKMTQMTHNWKIATSASIETGALAKLIANVQVSLSAEYGGSHVSTKNESSNEMTEEEEELIFELKPKESVYLWQYRMGLGEEPVLFCRDLKITYDPNPPTGVPLPPAQS